MNREGQTWCYATRGVVFRVLRSTAPSGCVSFWVHEIVYLSHESFPQMEGTKQTLSEVASQFETATNLVRLT